MDEYEEKDGVRMRRMVRLNLGNYDEKMNENKDVRILDKRMGENKTIEIEVEKRKKGMRTIRMLRFLHCWSF